MSHGMSRSEFRLDILEDDIGQPNTWAHRGTKAGTRNRTTITTITTTTTTTKNGTQRLNVRLFRYAGTREMQ
jgi:hypothetical protein